MFEKFLRFFGEEITYNGSKESLYEDFLTVFSGKKFGDGLFHVFVKDELPKWTELVEDAYPIVQGKIQLFGYDWLGRMFGIYKDESGERILLFEIGTDEILSIPCDFSTFLNVMIPTNHEACFATSFYKKWLRKKKIYVSYGKCIGYKIPLFMGGKDVVKNLEESDLEVYWSVITQVKNNMN